MNTKLRKDTLRISEEAAEWMDALENGNSEKNAAFAEWLHASPRHVEEFLLLTASDQALEQVEISNSGLEKLIGEGNGNVVELREDKTHLTPTLFALEGRRGRKIKWVAAAAVVGAVFVAWQWSVLFGGWESYTTATGEQRVIELADGSIMHLNTRTQVKVRLSEEGRDIRLVDGEALFKVAREAARPFRVDVGSAIVRAVGTQFNIDRSRTGTHVAVLEGRIEIENAQSPAQLGAGEGARIALGGSITRSTVNLTEVMAWQQRRLVFRDSTLAEIAEEFNRYNRELQLVIENADLKTRRYGGTFDADEPEILLKFLAGDEHLRLTRRGGTVVVQAQE